MIAHRLLLPALLLLSVPLAHAAVSFPGGRIAATHDGNSHDIDDVGATAMQIALLARAGLGTKLVHFNYNNNLGSTSATREQMMRESALGAAQRFGIPANRLFDCQQQLAAAIEHFRVEAEKSTASDPLWLLAAGPMEMPWRMINAVSASKRPYIRVVSHATWNETWTSSPGSTHNWNSIKNTGVTTIEISGQNKKPWNDSFSAWAWLKNHADADLRWLYTRNVISNRFDVSDAGMGYWLLTGGTNGGKQGNVAHADIRAVLEGSGGTPPPPSNSAPTVNAGPNRSVVLPNAASLAGMVSDDGLPSGTLSVQWSKVSGPGTVSFAQPTQAATTVTVSAAGTYVLRLTASDGALTASDDVTLTASTPTPPPGDLPDGWSSQRIGTSNLAGSVSAADGTWTIAGAGDIWGTADGCEYVYRPLVGDVTVTVRVTSQTNTKPWARAGLMLRASTAADARHASVFVTPGAKTGIVFQRRTSTGGTSASTTGSLTRAPAWLRVQRAGDVVTASESVDGVQWTIIGSVSIDLGASPLVGLAVSSREDALLSTATFTDLEIAPNAPVGNG